MDFDMLDKQNQEFHSVLVCSSAFIVLEVGSTVHQGSTVVLLFLNDDMVLGIMIKYDQNDSCYLVM